MAIEVIGPHPFERDEAGTQKTHVGTFFPSWGTLVTLPGIHATQRLEFIDRLNARRRAAGQPPLAPAGEQGELVRSVDLVFDAEQILIRPDPERMDLAIATGEQLEELVSKRDIRFLFVMDPRVRDAIKARGESWRISPLPQSPEDLRRLVTGSRVAIREQPIYYHNRFTGTRFVTWQEFARLEWLEAPALARQLQEIAGHCRERNRMGNPEVDFFAVDAHRFGPADFDGTDFTALPEAELRARFAALRERFAAAVEPEFRHDDPESEVWRHRMVAALLSQQEQTLTVEVLRNLSPEYFLQVEWLPGGRFQEGEFFFDSVFDEADRAPADSNLRQLCDPLVRGFVFNIIREYGDLDSINIGRVGRSLSKVRPLMRGRRGVYVVELKLRDYPQPFVRLIRLQKWGVHEHLDEGKPLLQSILESDEYTDYVLDRRLGLRQLGMILPLRIRMRRTRETYDGPNRAMCGQTIPVIYFERDYLGGLATDKLPPARYQKPGYAERLAALLGRAAAANIIAGRALEQTKQVMFDDGDEVVREGPETGLPLEIVVSDPTGSFADYQRSLLEVAKDYARPVNVRVAIVPRPREFADLYLAAFRAQFLHVQDEYRRRRRAFDNLFKHCHYNIGGSFAYRWERVLRRLDETDADALVHAILEHIVVPPEARP